MAYKTYVLPTLGFLAQFKRPSQKVLEAETKALAFMVPGPYKWCTKEDLYHCHESWGQQVSFPNVEDLCLAARCRLMQFENCAHGGLDIQGKKNDLGATLQNLDRVGRLSLWHSWYEDGMLANIHSSQAELAAEGLSIQDVLRQTLPEDDEMDEASKFRWQKKHFQATIRSLLYKRRAYDQTERLRHKLDRWGLPGLPGRNAIRCGKMLRMLHTCVPPRFRTAVWRTLFNGWCTSRRFQKQGACCFRCQSWIQEDSIEHYAICPIVKDFARRRLNIHPASWERCLFITLDSIKGTYGKEDLARHALWVYAVYKAHNFLRYRPLDEDVQPLDVLAQYAVEGTLGHPFAMNCLEGLFVQALLRNWTPLLLTIWTSLIERYYLSWHQFRLPSLAPSSPSLSPTLSLPFLRLALHATYWGRCLGARPRAQGGLPSWAFHQPILMEASSGCVLVLVVSSVAVTLCGLLQSLIFGAAQLDWYRGQQLGIWPMCGVMLLLVRWRFFVMCAEFQIGYSIFLRTLELYIKL